MTDADDEFEDDLLELLDFLAGKGKYRGLGKGDAIQLGQVAEDDHRHALLLELRRRGQARRKIVDGVAVWEATDFRRVD